MLNPIFLFDLLEPACMPNPIFLFDLLEPACMPNPIFLFFDRQGQDKSSNCVCPKITTEDHKISVAKMIELLLNSFLVYHSTIFEAWKFPKRPVELPYGVPDCCRNSDR